MANHKSLSFTRRCFSTHIGQIYSDFTSLETSPDINQLTKIMNSIVDSDMKIEEYKGYHPFLEEISDIAIKMASRNESFENMSQIHSFCKYFILKGETNDIDLWTNIESKIEELLPSTSSTDMILLMELLKRHDLLTPSLTRTLAKFTKEHLLGVENEDLAVAMALVCSEGLHDKSFISQLDECLKDKQLSNFSISVI